MTFRIYVTTATFAVDSTGTATEVRSTYRIPAGFGLLTSAKRAPGYRSHRLITPS